MDGNLAASAETEPTQRMQAATLPSGKQESGLAPGSVLTRAQELHFSRRGRRVLVVEPVTAAWYIVEDELWPVFAATARPVTLEGLIRRFPHLRPQSIRTLAAQLYYLGMLRVNGRPYHSVESLWKRPQPLGPTFLALHMAEGCNFRCTYCYNSAGSFSRRMPREIWRRILEKAFREIRAPHLTFDFMGGEPLLAFEEVVEAARYARELAERHGKGVSFAMQTNGSLLTEERVKVLKELGVGVGVSLDGPEEIHDFYRVGAGGRGTHRRVLENLLRARDAGLRVSPLAVIYAPENYREALEYFLDLGFVGMRFNYANMMGRARQHLSFAPERAIAYHRGFMEMVERALRWCKEHDRPLVIYDLNFMIRNVTSKGRDYMCMRSPCGAGDSILSFSVDGNVYACEEYEVRTRGKFLLGTLEELDLGNLMQLSEKLRRLKRRRVENIPKCSRCHLRYVCGGGCTHKALATFGELLREDPMCGFYMSTYEELMWKIWDDPCIVHYLGGV